VNLLERAHDRHHHRRRLRVLGRHLCELIPRGARVLDVGCGDGLLTRHVADRRPDLELRGVDVFVRGKTHVPVDGFDGQRLPFGDASFDAVMFIDVLHHAEDPAALLREGARVARHSIVIKDHCADGALAHATLGFMDRVSNRRHGIEIPHHYWAAARWREELARQGLVAEEWRASLGLYPWWIRFAFERGLHFAARLRVAGAGREAARATSARAAPSVLGIAQELRP
jgi:SAM-dependent methyltransferase